MAVKNRFVSTNGAGMIGHQYAKKKRNHDLYLVLYMKMNLK